MTKDFTTPFFVVCAALALCSSNTGCTSEIGREARASDGFIDFVGALIGPTRHNVVPVEMVPDRVVEIVTAHAEAGRGASTYVWGTLKRGFEPGDDSRAHIDVRVLATDRRPIATVATDYTPQPIPETYHSVVGRSRYGVRLPFVPAPGTTIQVSCHRVDLAECPYRRPLSSSPLNGDPTATPAPPTRPAVHG